MQALILSYLYLYIDNKPKATEVGAGDLTTSNIPTGLEEASTFFIPNHKMLTSLYNKMENGTFFLVLLLF